MLLSIVMCLNPIRLLNKSKALPLNGGSAYVTVPCGHCAECKQKRINFVMARLSAEYVSSFVTYVDTLTYNDNMLPILVRDNGVLKVVRNNGVKYNDDKIYNGVPCFCYDDLFVFFKRLNIRLIRAGYCVKRTTSAGKVVKCSPLKHFVSSEYGGQFHRPHYHIILYSCLDIPVDVLQHYVEDCWSDFGMICKYRKSDGRVVPYLAEDKLVKGNSAIAYVAKYAVKDDDFIDFFVKSIYCSLGVALPSDYHLIGYNKLLDDVIGEHLRRQVSPKTLISNGLGLSLLDNSNVRLMDKYGLVNVRDKAGVITNTIQAPDYVVRRRYYDKIKYAVKDDDKVHYMYVLNDIGVKVRTDQINDRVKQFVKRLSFVFNYPFDGSDLFDIDKTFAAELQTLVYKYQYNIYDFAVYCLFYRDRFFVDVNNYDIYSIFVDDKNIKHRFLKIHEALQYDDNNIWRYMCHDCPPYDFVQDGLMFRVTDLFHVKQFEVLYVIFNHLSKLINKLKIKDAYDKIKLDKLNTSLDVVYLATKQANIKYNNNMLHRANLQQLINKMFYD